ncbi:MAG: type IV pilus twitching motility protein PilT [Candidatus Sumerlaeota bacterium]
MTWSDAYSESRLFKALKKAWDEKASDLHLREDEPAVIRKHGDLVPISDLTPNREDIHKFIDPMLTVEQLRDFEERQELDSGADIEGVCRLRLNLFIQRHKLCVAIRLLPNRIPTMEELYLPRACTHFCEMHKGLVLVTGPTGSGKSTTLAAMLDYINGKRPVHMLTIEDPIEYVYKNKKAMVSQREIGDDSHTFASALRHAFRQDPDVVLLGEMRDLETMQMSITLAETGHLTFSTLHTGEAAQTVSRIVDSFPPHQQAMVRAQLGTSLAGVISQQLLPLKDGTGRVAAREVLVVNRGVANLIRENKLEQIQTAMQTGSSDMMFTMNYSIGHLYKSGFITYETAYYASFDKRDFQNKFGKGKA